MRHGLLLLAALGAACATAGASASGPAPGAVSNLPDFQLSSVDGDTVRLSDLVGRKVVVLTFWDTWCEPCKTELPLLDQIYRRHRAQGLEVLAIAMDDPSTMAEVAPFVRQSGFTFPVLLDPNGTAANLYNRQKTAPHMVVIARDGTIVSETSGFEPGAEKTVEALVEKLLAPHP